MVLQCLVRPLDALFRPRTVRPAAGLEAPTLVTLDQNYPDARDGALYRGAHLRNYSGGPGCHSWRRAVQFDTLVLALPSVHVTVESMKRVRPLFSALLSATLLSGCVQSSYNLATHHEDYTMTSTSKEVAVGRRIAHRVMEELTVAEDEPLQEKVRSIGDRIVAVCDRKELVYTFTVVKDEDVNAFSLPGGYVFINDGLIKKTATDDELAGVIAHEVAHITARQAVKRFEEIG